MKKLSLYVCGLMTVIFAACTSTRTGKIEGTISAAEGQLLVLEHLTDGNPRLVDTLRLDAAGHFSFKPEVEEGPDFFSLRLGNQSISLVIDTLLTPVTITASADNLAGGYEVADATNQDLKKAVMIGNRLRRQVLDLATVVNNGQMNATVGRDSLVKLVQNYKEQVLHDIIYINPTSPASYYVLFETVNGLTIFDSNDAADNRAFGAVATSWQFTYPNSPRNKVLEQKTLEGQRLRHHQARQLAERDSILNSTVTVATYPDLNLRDANDKPVALSSLVDGKSVIVVDFNAFFLASSPAHNMILNNIYEKYQGRVKIYQVCLDFDENFWKTSADNLPWVCVRDEEAIFDSNGVIRYAPSAQTYNVSTLPTSYIIDAAGNLQVRVEDDAKLEQEVRKAL